MRLASAPLQSVVQQDQISLTTNRLSCRYVERYAVARSRVSYFVSHALTNADEPRGVGTMPMKFYATITRVARCEGPKISLCRRTSLSKDEEQNVQTKGGTCPCQSTSDTTNFPDSYLYPHVDEQGLPRTSSSCSIPLVRVGYLRLAFTHSSNTSIEDHTEPPDWPGSEQ